jgi:hypothetical protein
LRLVGTDNLRALRARVVSASGIPTRLPGACAFLFEEGCGMAVIPFKDEVRGGESSKVIEDGVDIVVLLEEIDGVRRSVRLPVSGSVLETRVLTLEEIESWHRAESQRPIRINRKVMQFSEGLRRNGGMITGVITLGRVLGDCRLYLVDGSHRCEACRLSGLSEFIADVRIKHYASMAELAQDSIDFNNSLVRSRPDDVLRAQEAIIPVLRRIRQQCSFIGYDNIRRVSHSSAMVSMSCALRCWAGSSGETPALGGQASAKNPESLTEPEADQLCVFLNTAYTAWGEDPEYYRLWANLNLTMCMWLYRQLVLNAPTGSKRHMTVNLLQFKLCLTSLSATGDYLEWLVGRNMTERDRTPCYGRLRLIFGKRLVADGIGQRQLKFPQPAWARRR